MSFEKRDGSHILSSIFTSDIAGIMITHYCHLLNGFFAEIYSNFDKMVEKCTHRNLYSGIIYTIDKSKEILPLGTSIGNNANREIKWSVIMLTQLFSQLK